MKSRQIVTRIQSSLPPLALILGLSVALGTAELILRSGGFGIASRLPQVQRIAPQIGEIPRGVGDIGVVKC